MTFQFLADRVDFIVPEDLRHAKGWVGQLLEAELGATASTRPEPDFMELGVELKTIPVDQTGQVRESTFVCTIDLNSLNQARWETCALRRKLDRVLWIPVEADPAIPLAERKVGSPLLWSPNDQEESVLRSDWEDLTDVICQGYVDSLTAHRGTCLQVRPKARNAQARRWGTDDDGDAVRTLPRGFYLRRTFTQNLLQKHFTVSG